MNEIEIHRLDPASDWRYELKLTCDVEALGQARNWIRLHPEGFRTAYPPRVVNNIYLDTLELEALNANLSGVSGKQKLRIRWYGEDTDRPTLELKYKQNWLGGKKRFRLPMSIELARSWSHIMADLVASVPLSWQFILQDTNQPTLINRYRREYYVTMDGDIRVTIDYGQEVFDQSFSSRPNLHYRLPTEDQLVIELKGDASQAERLQEACAEFPIRLSRNSKYASNLRTGSR